MKTKEEETNEQWADTGDQRPRRPITVGDIMHAVFDGRLPESYSIEVQGDFGQAGLHRINADEDERASIEPYGDWNVPLGPGAVTVTIRDEDEARPEAGALPMVLLAQAMADCGRKLRHRDKEGSRRSATFSAARYAPATEALRLELWQSRTPIPIPVVVKT